MEKQTHGKGKGGAVNRVILIGRITGNPNYSETENWTPICTFGLAVARRYKREGETVSDLFRIVAWQDLAGKARKELHRGDRIRITGRAEFYTRVDEDGQANHVLNIVMDDFEYLGKAPDAPPQLQRITKPKLEPTMDKDPF